MKLNSNKNLEKLELIVYALLFILSLYIAKIIVGDSYKEFPITSAIMYIAMPVLGLTIGAIISRGIIIIILKITEKIIELFKTGLRK